MDINNFDRIRFNASTMCFVDISRLGKHSSNGIMATAYLMKTGKKYIQQKVEVRKKDNYVTLISYHYSDTEIDPYWQDAEVLFSWEEPRKEEQTND